jgi:hypothetical protein
VAAERDGHGPDDGRGHEHGPDAVSELVGYEAGGALRPEPAERQREIGDGERRTGVAHQCTGQHLKERDGDRGCAQRPQRRAARVSDRRGHFHPGGRGHECDDDGEAEEDLGEPGVRHGDRDRQLEEDGDAPEHALQHHRHDRRGAQPAHPAPRLGPPQPDREHDREQADGRRHHPVSVLEQHATGHVGEELTEGERPVGHGEGGAGAGDQPADEQQHGGGDRDSDGVAMQRGAIRRRPTHLPRNLLRNRRYTTKPRAKHANAMDEARLHVVAVRWYSRHPQTAKKAQKAIAVTISTL